MNSKRNIILKVINILTVLKVSLYESGLISLVHFASD